jgi:hypothetical protein
MKKFEIEVVRTYTTTIEVELPDNLTTSEVEAITRGARYDTHWDSSIEDMHSNIWDKMGEAEMEQMDADIESIEVKELGSDEYNK